MKTKLIDIMQDYLAENSLTFFRAPNQDALFLTFPKSDHRDYVYITVDEDIRCLMIRVDSGLFVPAERLSAAGVFITRANYGLKIGGFQMNWDTGEVFFHASLLATVDACTEQLVELMHIAISMYAQYHLGLMLVALRGGDPEALTALIEGRPNHKVSEDQVKEVFDRLVEPIDEPSFGTSASPEVD